MQPNRKHPGGRGYPVSVKRRARALYAGALKAGGYLSLGSIAEQIREETGHNVSMRTLSRYCRDLIPQKAETMRRVRSQGKQALYERAASMYDAGFSATHIGEQLGVSTEIAGKYARLGGAAMRTLEEAKKLAFKRRKPGRERKIAAMGRARADGATITEVGCRFGYSRQYASELLRSPLNPYSEAARDHD